MAPLKSALKQNASNSSFEMEDDSSSSGSEGDASSCAPVSNRNGFLPKMEQSKVQPQSQQSHGGERQETFNDEEKQQDDASLYLPNADDDSDDDDASVWSFHGNKKRTTKRSKRRGNDDGEEPADRDTVYWLRAALWACFVVLILGVPTFHVLVFRQYNSDKFSSVYDIEAAKILDLVQQEYDQMLRFVDGLSRSAVTYPTSDASLAAFPFFPDLDQMAMPGTAKHQHQTDSPIVLTVVSPVLDSQQLKQDWAATLRASNTSWPTGSAIKRQSHIVDHQQQVVLTTATAKVDALLPVLPTTKPVADHPVAQLQPVHLWAIGDDLTQLVLPAAASSVKPGNLGNFVDAASASYVTYFRGMTGDNDLSFDASTTPVSWLHYPIASVNGADAILSVLVDWSRFLDTVMRSARAVDQDDENDDTQRLVLSNTCDGVFTFQINEDNSVTPLGFSDSHSNGDFERKLALDHTLLPSSDCRYTIAVYPTTTDAHDDDDDDGLFVNIYLTTALIIVLLILAMLGAVYYDRTIRSKLVQVLENSKVDHAVAKQMFPQRVLQRILNQPNDGSGANQPPPAAAAESAPPQYSHPKQELKSLLTSTHGPKSNQPTTGEDDMSILHQSPLAELFPYCTVAFTDISGFSAWSSEREPEQVFTLLENIFQTMDALARRRGVFKVETIGDSYMAVTGLPDPQSDHALRMARFARDCMHRVHEQFRMLEISLGPDTGELRLKIGMHSGQVTAGVLRGQKTRFQLFGDTVNTASRMESTCLKSRIQISETTARLLIQNGKRGWVRERLNAVHAKGKGILKTFWLATSAKGRSAQSVYTTRTNAKTVFHANDDSDEEDEDEEGVSQKKSDSVLPSWSRNAKQQRLIDWLVQLLETQLKEVIVQRRDLQGPATKKNHFGSNKQDIDLLQFPDNCVEKGDMVLDEVVEAFSMPKQAAHRDGKASQAEAKDVELPDEVKEQLREYVAAISDRYRFNSFHSFEHASHVTMASVKLLKRIVAPEDEGGHIDKAENSTRLHDHTYGIASDALAQFAVVFGALIHDVDHTGVPNGQLGKENVNFARRYKNESLAEQNSVDIAWNLLMSAEYRDLQQSIFTTRHELKRFRQYVVNFVMATDIFNPKMKSLRNQRWDKAFSTQAPRRASDVSKKSLDLDSLHSAMLENGNGANSGDDSSEHDMVEEALNLKATIVLEHIIQAADVSHTMQHWNVYKKWNERLFMEMYSAFKSNRAQKDPSGGWYAGELWFFDNYIIPLAQKLDQCRVFGVSSDECLNYALENRKEWSDKGMSIVEEMVEKHQHRAKHKANEVGGFAPAEIKAFTQTHLEYVLVFLKKKGEFVSTTAAWDRSGMRSAAQSLLDALEIYQKCPTSTKMEDLTVVFTICCKIITCINDGRLLQTDDRHFEENVACFFSYEARELENKDTTHYSQALGTVCNVFAARGDFDNAINTATDLAAVYSASVHSYEISNIYGIDFALDALANRVIWLYAAGPSRQEEMLEAFNYTIAELVPKLDSYMMVSLLKCLLPCVVSLRDLPDQVNKLNDVFEQYIVKYHSSRRGAPTGVSDSQVSIPTIKFLLRCWATPNSANVPSGSVQYALRGGEALLANMETKQSEDDQFATLCLTRPGWCPFTMHGELCCILAKKLLLQPDSSASPKVRQTVRELAVVAHKVITQAHQNFTVRDSFKKNAAVSHLLNMAWDNAVEIGSKVGYEIIPERDPPVFIDETKPLSLETSLGSVWIME